MRMRGRSEGVMGGPEEVVTRLESDWKAMRRIKERKE
jgi:hypothetical protein